MTAAAAPRLTGGVIASAVFHGAIIAAFIFLRPAPQPPSAPIYRVQLFAAPAGERAVGVVQEAPKTPAPTTPPPPVKSAAPRTKVPAAKAKPTPQPKVATPSAPTKQQPETKTPPAPAPTAGGGETGGKGADVANIDTNGLDFPYPWYTSRIAREILLRFRSTATLTADVRFVIQRDGTVDPASIKIVTSSRNYSFDQQALGAVESAANAKAFGALPPGFQEDILPVTFRFSPSLLKK